MCVHAIGLLFHIKHPYITSHCIIPIVCTILFELHLNKLAKSATVVIGNSHGIAKCLYTKREVNYNTMCTCHQVATSAYLLRNANSMQLALSLRLSFFLFLPSHTHTPPPPHTTYHLPKHTTSPTHQLPTHTTPPSSQLTITTLHLLYSQ